MFSDEVGDPIGQLQGRVGDSGVEGAGHQAGWKSYGWTALTPACLAEFRRIDLRWHDLRHEYASRLVERNVPLAQVHELLGHASITTTERYDNQKLENLQAATAHRTGSSIHLVLRLAPPNEASPSTRFVR